ncbi:MAG: lipid-A-disaccharide synthase [Sphingobacteriales bacterium]|jgi:lipid-A-disaccharide synthase
MKYYIISGEPSGDLHGSNLLKSIKELDNSAKFRGMGGDLMKAQGLLLLKHISDFSVMGFVEVIKKLPSIFKLIKSVKTDILNFRPDVVVLIDYPGFNMKIAKFAKENGFKVIYYIPPKVWAWNTKRALKLKKYCDHILTILPFETDFYKSYGIKNQYVGNPTFDQLHDFKPQALSNNNLTHKKSLVALLPGSRKMELKNMLPLMNEVSKYFPNRGFVICGAPGFTAKDYKDFGTEIPVLFDKTYDILASADAALVASGTATLETALLNCPQVVLYRASPISIYIGRLVIKVKFISLVNLILNKMAIPELIQQDCETESVRNHLQKILTSKSLIDEQKKFYAEMKELLGKPGCNRNAAKIIVDSIS